jgi:hypothetical protein
MRMANVAQTETMPRRLLCICLAAFGLLIPPSALGAKAPAATVGKPRIESVRVLRADDSSRVAVAVVVRHAALGDVAVGAQGVGTATVVLSRFVGDRNFSIAGGTASWSLPTVGATAALYVVTLNAKQGKAVEAASTDGVLRALVLVDERVRARGRAPARNGNFDQRDARVVPVATAPVALPPLFTGGGRRVAIGADARGRSFVESATVPVSGGRTLVLTPQALVPTSGEPATLGGKVTLLGADGAVLTTFAAPPGITFAVSPTGKRRGTLVWPAFQPEGADPIDAGTALLSPPPTR